MQSTPNELRTGVILPGPPLESADPDGRIGQRIPELDGLRGVAILLVLIWHYFVGLISATDFPVLDHFLGTALSTTWSGVDMFFVLSGFLIGGILIDQRTSPSFFRTFYIRRVCRILPAYYLLIGLFLVAAACGLSRQPRFDWLFERTYPIWSYATFTQSFTMLSGRALGGSWLSPTWSLAIEEQFHLVLPLFVYICSPRKLPYFLAALVFLAPVLRVLIAFAWPDCSLAGFLLTPCRADALLLGVLGAWAWRVPAIVGNLRRNAHCLYWVLGALFCGVAVMAWKRISAVSLFSCFFGYAWLAIFYLVTVVVCLVEKHGLVSWLVRHALIRKLGVISYGVYLLHLPVSGLCHGLIRGEPPKITDMKSAGVTLLALLVTLTLAKLSFVFFEKPIIDLGHNYRYAKSRSEAAA